MPMRFRPISPDEPARSATPWWPRPRHCRRSRPSETTLLGTMRGRRAAAALGLCTTALVGCSPYPDDGEFLAGVVYATNFLTGVKTLDALAAVGQGKGVSGFAPYTVIATTQGAATPTTVTASTIASSPFWTDGKRKPLDRTSTQQAYVLDSSCVGPPDYRFDERLDLIRLDRQYPVFADIPEYLTTNVGKAGRSAAYSAIIEVIHLTAPPDFPCQSIKRFDTAQGRVGPELDLSKDLREVRREYRLLQIFDPAIALPPLPVQLGFYNQLVVPYLDMGPVPLSADGTTFLTMPIYKVSDKAGKTQVVVPGTAQETLPPGGVATVYSPICQDHTLTMLDALPPPNAADPAYQAATKTGALSSCLVCRTLDGAVDPDTNKFIHLDCPFRQSQGTP